MKRTSHRSIWEFWYYSTWFMEQQAQEVCSFNEKTASVTILYHKPHSLSTLSEFVSFAWILHWHSIKHWYPCENRASKALTGVIIRKEYYTLPSPSRFPRGSSDFMNESVCSLHWKSLSLRVYYVHVHCLKKTQGDTSPHYSPRKISSVCQGCGLHMAPKLSERIVTKS